MLIKKKGRSVLPQSGIGNSPDLNPEIEFSLASHTQRRMWVLNQLDPSNCSHNLVVGMWLHGAMDISLLQKSAQAVVARHSILRTNFAFADGALRQNSSSNIERALVINDLSEKKIADRQTHAKRALQAETIRPFDLAEDPLFSWRLTTFAPTNHLLILRTHQIVCDEESAQLAFEELLREYRGEIRDEAAQKLPQYSEFTSAEWQKQDDPTVVRQLEYWRKKLCGELPLLELPTLSVRPAIESYWGDRRPFQIDPSSASLIEKLAHRQEVDPTTIILAAYVALLSRYGGQEDILVGSSDDGRYLPGSRQLIGPLANCLVLRFDLSGNPSFLDLIERVAQVVEEARQNREISFARLVEEVHTKRDLGHMPLFQAGFVAPRPWEMPPSPMGIRIEPIEVEIATEEVDLTLVVQRNQTEWRGWLQFNTDLFSGDMVEQMLRHLRALLADGVADPGKSVARLSLLAEEESQQLTVKWNQTKKEYPRSLGVHGLFERQTTLAADRQAVTTDTQSLTYGQLNAKSNQLAHHLRALGVGPGVGVGVCLDRSVEMVVGVLGVLKAGGFYLPLDAAFPQDRLKYMLEDSAAPVIVTLDNLLGKLPRKSATIVCLDRDAQAIARRSDANPSPLAGDDDLAYIIYTSGSTGKPKGVEVTHGGLVNFIAAANRIVGISASDAFMAVTTLSFDICGFDLYGPLSAGGKVLLIDRETAADGIRLRQRLENCDATILQATPATWRMLLEAGWQGKLRNRPIKAFSGGEALGRDLADELLARSSEVWNLYGPTETTIYSTYHKVNHADGPVPIGRPLDNTSLYILDQLAQPVPTGVVGELYIGGAGVARGYRNRPELSAEKFLPDPFSSEPGARMYRTGDMVRYRPGGIVEYLGRSDHQVKIRGFRIELGEIEAHLLKLPGVRGAVVVAGQSDAGPPRLVAYAVGASGEELNSSALHQGLRASLPDYMIPAIFVSLPSFPMTPNGKIDRKALPSAQWGQSAENDFVAPQNGPETQLAEIFGSVLKVPRVGARDSFFDLGGDSLRAVSLAVHIQKVFGKTITLAELFQAPTVGELARVLQDDSPLTRSTLVMLRRVGHKPPLFCLPGSGGYSLNFRSMVNLLPEDRPVYGYNLPPLRQGELPLTSISAYAADALKQIRAVQPHGPYHLLGYSFGGTLAFEMAQILSQTGEKAAFLGLIDTFGYGFPYKLSPMRRAIVHATNILRGTPKQKNDYLRARFRNISRRISQKFRGFARPRTENGDQNPSVQQMINDVRDVAEWAMRNYRPKPVAGRLTLFRVDLQPDDWPGCSFDDITNGWRPFVQGEIDVVRLPCRHLEVFQEPNLSLLATAVSTKIEPA